MEFDIVCDGCNSDLNGHWMMAARVGDDPTLVIETCETCVEKAVGEERDRDD